jgi:hypothetical protein
VARRVLAFFGDDRQQAEPGTGFSCGALHATSRCDPTDIVAADDVNSKAVAARFSSTFA